MFFCLIVVLFGSTKNVFLIPLLHGVVFLLYNFISHVHGKASHSADFLTYKGYYNSYERVDTNIACFSLATILLDNVNLIQ